MQPTPSASTVGCAELSLLTPVGYQSGDCGYCKTPDSSQRTPDSRASYYARSKSTCPAHYQMMMDRGWRRSGVLYYLPDAARSCCPHYTIRLPAAQFRPSRDQRQCLHRWNRFVLGEQYSRERDLRYPKTKAEKKQDHAAFDLTSTIHESEHDNLKPDLKAAHKFTVTLEPDVFTEEKFRLFENYQRHVHHEGDGDITRAGFRRFLCSSPLHRDCGENDNKRLGSFHHCYRLDGRLIAMAVLDLLPHAVSGVYFLYHSDYERWSLGKLSALREATLALDDDYGYYYMGYYIHGCKKMRYKGDFRPQYVLDYHSFEWDVLDEQMRALMDREKYASMSKERARQQASLEESGSNAAINSDTPMPDPVQASGSSKSLLELTMPGVMSTHDLNTLVDIDSMRVYLGRAGTHRMDDLVSWNEGEQNDSSSIKGMIAELAAAIGPEVARCIVVDLSR